MLLQASGIVKRYGAAPVLAGVNLQIGERDRIGLVGANGAGKSTLLRILAGELAPDEGTLAVRKDIRIGYLAQHGGFDGLHTIRDAMRSAFGPLLEVARDLKELERRLADPAEQAQPERYEALLARYAEQNERFRAAGGYGMDNRIRSVLHGMGFGHLPPDTPVAALSGGQRRRLALARLLAVQPDLLLLDEPTNHLDLDTLAWLEQYLRGFGGALVVVSHDRYFLDATVDTIVEIERHVSTKYTGNYTRYMEQKAAAFERQMRRYEQQRREIARMEDFIRRNIARASTARRAQSRRKALERIERLERPAEARKAHFSFAAARRSGRDVLTVTGAAAAPAPGLKPLFRNVSFELKRGERVAVLGPNGVGKTTLLRALIGELPLLEGTVQWGAGVELGYYDQEQSDLTPANTVLEEVWSAFPRLAEGDVRSVLGQFLFSGEDVKKTIGSLSGGEKARVALAKLMLRNANVLVLDEPTNHLDLLSREVLEAALEEYDGTLLFVSHDRYFLNRFADRIVELHPDGVRHFLGNYDDMLDKKREMAEWEAVHAQEDGPAAAPAAFAAEAGVPANDYEAGKRARREERARRRQLERVEADIERLEREIAELEAEMASPDVCTDYKALQEKGRMLAERREALEQAYRQWEELMAD